jgi:hypothetical protein
LNEFRFQIQQFLPVVVPCKLNPIAIHLPLFCGKGLIEIQYALNGCVSYDNDLSLLRGTLQGDQNCNKEQNYFHDDLEFLNAKW